jgi:multidrug efflux pump subunit AcrA (membrane-fusion protein)
MFTAFLARLEDRPVASFLAVLAALFCVIALSSALQAPGEVAELPEQTVKSSRLFVAGTDESRMTVVAQVKKTDTIDIIALAPGIVKSIAVRPGQIVGAGQTVASLTADYASGATALSQERASLQASLTEKNYTLEKEINELERKIAKGDDTKSDREEKAEINRLKLELDRLKTGRETAKIDLALALRSDAALNPRSLVRGTIEHIAVRPGELISAGTVLMTLHASAGSSTLEAAFPKKVSDALMEAGIAELILGGESHTLSQGYRAKTETAAGLVMVTYPLPETLASSLAQHEYVNLSVPLLTRTETDFLIPIDAVRSTSEENSVIVMGEDHLTRTQSVTLGETVGASVSVKSGLTAGDMIVLDASVLPGERIEPIR